MTIGTYSLTLHPALLQRGFWLYAWEVIGSEGEELVYVGRTGDNSSPNASPVYIRMGQHLGLVKTQNALRRNLERRGIRPERCRAFHLVSHGPLYPEVEKPDGFSHEDQMLRKHLMATHVPRRDIVGAMEKQLALDLAAAGYTLLNTVNWRPTISPELWKPVREAFATHFPRLKD